MWCRDGSEIRLYCLCTTFDQYCCYICSGEKDTHHIANHFCIPDNSHFIRQLRIYPHSSYLHSLRNRWNDSLSYRWYCWKWMHQPSRQCLLRQPGGDLLQPWRWWNAAPAQHLRTRLIRWLLHTRDRTGYNWRACPYRGAKWDSSILPCSYRNCCNWRWSK